MSVVVKNHFSYHFTIMTLNLKYVKFLLKSSFTS